MLHVCPECGTIRHDVRVRSGDAFEGTIDESVAEMAASAFTRGRTNIYHYAYVCAGVSDE